MKIFKIKSGILIENDGQYFLINSDWDEFINRDDLYQHAKKATQSSSPISNAESLLKSELLPPIGSQEIWGSGVTYLKSREARKEEAKDAGGGDFYQRVYDAERPEIFFKGTPLRAVGSGQSVKIRKDSKWNVPEPELTLMISSNAKIIGYTVGNDMSSRDIEGENPLYLPQAKTYDKSSGIGPGIYVSESPLPLDSKVAMQILRGGKTVFEGEVLLSQMKRKREELVGFLCRECSFPKGCLLMTGTGIIPSNDFTLNHGDEIRITIDHIGTLVNTVE